jgi:hypothetical protein
MVKVTHIASNGTETATVKLDDFTVKVMYSGIADMLREAASLERAERVASCEFSLVDRQRRETVRGRLRNISACC